MLHDLTNKHFSLILTTYVSFLVCFSCLLTKLSNLTHGASFLLIGVKLLNPLLLRVCPNRGGRFRPQVSAEEK